MKLSEEIKTIIENCINGYSTKDLLDLYNSPNRNNVPWHLFPNWARPDIKPEGCHEG